MCCFPVARFREVTGVYPARITVIGHDFKRRRFEQLHRRALRWSKLRFTYVGIPLGTVADEREAAFGEVGISFPRSSFPLLCNLNCFSHLLPTILQRANAFTPYSSDLYGCHVPLVQKRAGRNSYSKAHGYYVAAPEMRVLLERCPKDGTRIFPGARSWAKE